MYYVLWFVGIIAACMLSAVTGLWVEHISSDKESNNQ
ncbi:cytochrome bd oxidase small subunit, CydX/CbdX family [Gilliamella sp. B3464]|nr:MULTISPECIES: cytochrome bd oxidase small subunit, CydX/CbdX family [Gilliamella]MCX8711105.1 cytochrome bd oxidase small subunit, CydX/CbdX family [Gilliamella sp. B3468]MCX8726649.1 cytochrome bd oxidase small subunit, CydX/CbdX family [Gilliamella sp. B2838]MCX8737948.1 cytochrome bd oxidase small subunit, CydX/CbdX family [Gilliamella sp. B2824]MCX8750155.1 cytochrome bd oxidase small subunit, CydX/CbdX family [Gilliamella sp. B3464]